MRSCSLHHWVLFLLTLTFTTVPTLARTTSVKVKLHRSATLPCKYECSGLIKWTLSQNPDFILVRCDQTGCWREKGYNVSHDQYLKGNLSLTVTAVDYRKRAVYTCDCDGVDVCDVRLIIDTITSSVELNPGEALVMELPVLEPVAVIYKARGSDSLYGEQICAVTERSLLCEDEYTLRTSLSHTTITLREVNVSDCGLYTIRDTKNIEDIHIYALAVKVVQLESESKSSGHLVLGVMLGMLVLIVIIVGAVFVVKKRHAECIQQEKADLEETIQLNKSKAQVDKSLQRANSDSDVLQLGRQIMKLEGLILEYKSKSGKSSPSCTSLNDIPLVELLMRKMAEMDEVLQSREISEQDTMGHWWSLKRPELDTIMEHWNMTQNLTSPHIVENNINSMIEKTCFSIHPPDSSLLSHDTWKC